MSGKYAQCNPECIKDGAAKCCRKLGLKYSYCNLAGEAICVS